MSEPDKYDQEVAEMLANESIAQHELAAMQHAGAARLRGDGVFRQQHRDCDAMGVENQHMRAELARLKRIIQKAAGMTINRCLCVFEADDDSAPVIQCDYHKEQAAEIVWALAKLDRSEFEREHGNCYTFEYHEGLAVAEALHCNDPRHTWTDEQWQQARRANLEGE